MNDQTRVKVLTEREVVETALRSVGYWPTEPAQLTRPEILVNILQAINRLDDGPLLALMRMAVALAYT